MNSTTLLGDKPIRRLVLDGRQLGGPGVFDPYDATIVRAAGNALIRRGGSGTAATHLGVRSLPHCPAAAPMATDVVYADEH